MLDISIHPNSFNAMESAWTDGGEIYAAEAHLAEQGVTHKHAYGTGTGSFVYVVELPAFTGSAVEIGARLSGDALFYTAPYDAYSDVELLVNDQPQGTRLVIPDAGPRQSREGVSDLSGLE